MSDPHDSDDKNNEISSRKPIRLIKDYEKIAAGEVIERPASVVKELVENALDANATSITVIILDYGKELIQVIDNGIGIPENELVDAFRAHTSSKISSADELLSLSTLGFRGEALYSIAAISKVEIVTKTENNDIAARAVIEGGKITSQGSIGSPKGTNIKVRELFYNTPVRYKFLKTDRVEMGHITDIITRLTLAYPEIHFKLVHNDITIINSPSTKKHENVIFDIYGKRVAKNIKKFDVKDSKFEIWGYLGEPKLSRGTKSMSTVFINRRYVKSPLVEKVMEEAYRDFVMINKHPFYIIFLEIQPDMVDFNIHPTKKLVRFEDEQFLLRRMIHLMKNIVKSKFGSKGQIETRDETLGKKNKTVSRKIEEMVPDAESNEQKFSTEIKTPVNTEKRPLDEFENMYPIKSQIIKKDEHNHENQALTAKKPTLDSFYPIAQSNSEINGKNPPAKSPKPFFDRNQWIQTSAFPDMKLINAAGQLNDLYIVFENDEGFFLLDQHAAAERINYEEQLRYYKSGGIKKQELLKPLILDVAVNEVDFLKSNTTHLKKFGFDIDHMGSSSFAIRAVPAILSGTSQLEILEDICMEIIEIGKQSSFENEVDKIIKYIACHKSLRGGDIIRDPQKAKYLLEKLARCQNPHHCAHGRPTILHFTWNWVEKEFHRRT